MVVYNYFSKISFKASIVILDFEDSFTYNIFSTLVQMGIAENNIEVIPYKNVLAFLKNCNLVKANTQEDENNERLVLIYGPGPGHPSDYQHLYGEIKRLLLNRSIFHLGICLGHQILWNIIGFEVKRSDKPLHGQVTPFCIPHWSGIFPQKFWSKQIEVQCYNSLVVDTFSFIQKFPAIKKFDLVLQCLENQRSFNCMAGRFERGVTYQFHPESIATSERFLFFKGILKFLSKKKNY
ncbi:MAG: aminodeoxychorismate/anthranilate synthase component II [Oligoflexia bacterium]|nr:aminodeoxychorismate/anthranilate synthase component II [Oligoflexia bacterium]